MGIRKKIVLDKAIPALQRNGFDKSPFSGADFGWHGSLGYFYELCRITEGSILETVTIELVKRDKWIKVFLNAFELNPVLKSLSELDGLDGIQFKLPPASTTQIRVHSDDIKGIPLLSCEFMGDLHKLKRSYTQRGQKSAIRKLESRIENDMTHIDFYFSRWYKLHQPLRTTWEGKTVE